MKTKIFITLTLSLITNLLITHPSSASILTKNTPSTATFITDKPNANTTVENPLKLKISALGMSIYVNVTNIKARDTAAQKADKIRQAIRNQAPSFTVRGASNEIIIENVKKVEIIADPTRENLDKLNLNKDYRSLFIGSSLASGRNTIRQPSLIQVGIENLYIAQVTPVARESFSSILSKLEMLLDSNNINATFDASTGSLSLDDLLRPDQTFVFGNTDTRLNTKASVGIDKSMEVPESSPVFGLLIFGSLGLGIIFKGLGTRS